MRNVIALFAALLLAAGVTGTAAASGGAGLHLEPAPVNRLDAPSLQRGARIFVNYCLNCHGAKYMRYNKLTDIGIDLAMIQDNLVFATDKVANTMSVSLTPAEGKAWFGAPPPDLTVEARVRGSEWLYNYFLAFYQDEKSATGWNNLVFPAVAMPHVLWEVGGTQSIVTREYETHEQAEGAAIAAKKLVLVGPATGGKWAVSTLAIDKPGTLNPAQYQAFVADLVNFMDYMAEPVRNKRINVGIAVLLYLALLFACAYLLKREVWKDVH